MKCDGGTRARILRTWLARFRRTVMVRCLCAVHRSVVVAVENEQGGEIRVMKRIEDIVRNPSSLFHTALDV